VGEFFKYLNFIPEFHTGDQVLESIFFILHTIFCFYIFTKLHKFIWRQSMYFACLFRLRSMLPLRFQKKMQCFRLEIKSFVVAGKKINDVGVFPSLPYVHKLTLNNAETWYYRGRQKGHIRCDLERKKKYLHIISQRKMKSNKKAKRNRANMFI
jgi:hypothetical protein